MEDGLVQKILSNYMTTHYVLILVVMEDGLVLPSFFIINNSLICLNPCCDGRWSRTKQDVAEAIVEGVLILVVMEDGLVQE